MKVTIIDRIGAGVSGEVYLMETKTPEREINKYGLKVITLNGNKESDDRKRREVEIMKKIKHESIVQYYSSFELKDRIMLYMEYCRKGSLLTLLNQLKSNKSYLVEDKVVEYATQVANALKYLHIQEPKIVHRDLKPANIFLTEDDVIKVGDFGISRLLENSMDFAETVTGTILYMAPEIKFGNNYSTKVDVWSFGCCLHELMSLQYAFNPKADTICEDKIKAKYNVLPSQYSCNLQDLVKLTIEPDPCKRLSSTDVYSFLVGMAKEFAIPNIPKKSIVDAYSDFIKNNLRGVSDSSADESDSYSYSDDFDEESEKSVSNDEKTTETLTDASTVIKVNKKK